MVTTKSYGDYRIPTRDDPEEWRQRLATLEEAV